ncbi:hypothetical protein [Streptomyces sp. NPDC001843]|uniref:hypothetical protein n=1 Tax=Streptomyces sp. NPDC001843 TaxID=3364617 RepID=UPI0036C741D1
MSSDGLFHRYLRAVYDYKALRSRAIGHQMSGAVGDVAGLDTEVRNELPSATSALSSGAYRVLPFTCLDETFPSAVRTQGKLTLFRPDFGEALTRAFLTRIFSEQAAPLVPSFGVRLDDVIDHSLHAAALRRRRDRILTAFALITGWAFLPGALVWIVGLVLRGALSRAGATIAGRLLPFTLVAAAACLLVAAPTRRTGPVCWYAAAALVVPAVGWLLSRHVALRTADALRSSALAALGDHPGALNPGDAGHEQVGSRRIAELQAQQRGNMLFASDDSREQVFGIGRKWGQWTMVTPLVPAPGRSGMAFHNFDFAEALERSFGTPQDRGGDAPEAVVRHVAVFPGTPQGRPLTRPTGPEYDGYGISASALRSICGVGHVPGDPRHAVCVQQFLHDGQILSTFLVSSVLEGATLHVIVRAYALGPLSAVLNRSPRRVWGQVLRAARHWQTESPIDDAELVRLLARAPFSLLSARLLDWLGGRLVLPEPFGLRSAAAQHPFTQGSFADDILRGASPVLRQVHAAVVGFLGEHEMDVAGLTPPDVSFTATDGGTPAMSDLAEWRS